MEAVESREVLTKLQESPKTLDPVNAKGSTNCESVGRVPMAAGKVGVSCQHL